MCNAKAWLGAADAVSIEWTSGESKVASKTRRKGLHPLTLLLLIPYAAMMWVPFYNRVAPELAGIPFFYWYQMLWIVLGAAVMLPIYFREERAK